MGSKALYESIRVLSQLCEARLTSLIDSHTVVSVKNRTVKFHDTCRRGDCNGTYPVSVSARDKMEQLTLLNISGC